MAEYDLIDEAIINEKPDIVYKALLTQYSGETKWWMPYLEAKSRGGGAVDEIGTLIDVTLHDKMPVKFTIKTDETKENELLQFQYVEGAFRGKGTWKLEEVDGNTKVSYRWCGSTCGLLFKILTSFTSIPKGHSKLMKSGFAGLNEYIKESVES